MNITDYDPNVVNAVVAILALMVSVLAYLLARSQNNASLPWVAVEWKTSHTIALTRDNGRPYDKYVLFEALVTNVGGKTIELVELVPEKDYFVSYWCLNSWEKVHNIVYDGSFDCFRVDTPMAYFVTRESLKAIDSAVALPIGKQEAHGLQIPLSARIEPGCTERVTLCFVFRYFVHDIEPGRNRVIGIKLVFNNKQTSSTGLLLEENLSICKQPRS